MIKNVHAPLLNLGRLRRVLKMSLRNTFSLQHESAFNNRVAITIVLYEPRELLLIFFSILATIGTYVGLLPNRPRRNVSWAKGCGEWRYCISAKNNKLGA